MVWLRRGRICPGFVHTRPIAAGAARPRFRGGLSTLLLVRGFDYNFRENTLICFKHTLPEGWNSEVCLKFKGLFWMIGGEIIVKSPYQLCAGALVQAWTAPWRLRPGGCARRQVQVGVSICCLFNHRPAQTLRVLDQCCWILLGRQNFVRFWPPIAQFVLTFRGCLPHRRRPRARPPDGSPAPKSLNKIYIYMYIYIHTYIHT